LKKAKNKDASSGQSYISVALFEPAYTVGRAAEISGLKPRALKDWLARDVYKPIVVQGDTPNAKSRGWRRLSLIDVVCLAGMSELVSSGITTKTAAGLAKYFRDRVLEFDDKDNWGANVLIVGQNSKTKGAVHSQSWVGKIDDVPLVLPGFRYTSVVVKIDDLIEKTFEKVGYGTATLSEDGSHIVLKPDD